MGHNHSTSRTSEDKFGAETVRAYLIVRNSNKILTTFECTARVDTVYRLERDCLNIRIVDVGPTGGDPIGINVSEFVGHKFFLSWQEKTKCYHSQNELINAEWPNALVNESDIPAGILVAVEWRIVL